jgi:HSP90 family molecular chaperone
MYRAQDITREWDLLNKQKPIWMRNPEEVTTEEYGAFYKSITTTGRTISYQHFAVEGAGVQVRAHPPKRASCLTRARRQQ